MAEATQTGIYLIVEFDWPENITKEHGDLARALHDALQKSDWVEETVAGSGGLGGEQGSIWIFKLQNYAALDRLLRDREDPLSQAYVAFFSQMRAVRDRVREEVAFL